MVGFIRDHTEILVLAAILVAIQLFPRRVPGGIYGIGIVDGSYLALHAIGVILVYRSHRIINFAQVQTGVLAAALFTVLVQYRPLLRAYTAVCPACEETPTLVDVNYWVSAALGLAAAVLVSYAVYFFVIRRFATAPRLIVTVATIFVAQLLGGIQGALPTLLSTEEQRFGGVQLAAPELPFEWTLTWEPIPFNAPDLLAVVTAALAVVGIVAWLRLSQVGTVIRATGERPERARTLGVSVTGVNGRVWIVAGLLSGAAAIISATVAPPSPDASLDLNLAMRILAVAVIARMSSVPLAAAGAVVVGVLLQGIVWAWGSDVLLDSVLLGVLVVVIAAQNYRPPRDLEQASEWRAAREVRPIPRQLRSLPVVRGWTRAGIGVGVAALLVLPWGLSVGQVSLASLAVIYAIVGLSLLVLTGWVGHISLGQFAFAAVGAYAVAALRLPFPLALPVGAVAGAVVAALVGVPALRLRGLHLAVLTLGLAVAAPVVLISRSYLGRHLPDSVSRPRYLGIDFDDQRTYYYVCVVVLALATAAVMGLRRGRTARALVAGRDNEAAARAFGINLVQARIGAYAVSGALAGLAGSLYAFHQYGVRSGGFLPGVSVTVFIMAVIGGLGTVAGPLIGAVYVGTLLVLSASPVVTFLATGGGGLFLLLLVPGGVSQLLFALRDAWLRRLAYHRGIVVPSLVTGALAGGRLGGRIAIAPKGRLGGTPAAVPPRYRLDGQWAMPDLEPGAVEEKIGG